MAGRRERHGIPEVNREQHQNANTTERRRGEDSFPLTSIPVVASELHGREALRKKEEALLKRAKDGLFAEVRALLNDVVSPNYENSKGETALMLASGQGHENVASLLIERGANIDTKNQCNNYTALHYAARGRSGRCIPLLVKAGAQVDSKSHTGGTPLYCAARIGNEEAVKALIDAGASIDEPDNKRKTPWDVAKTDAIKEIIRPSSTSASPCTTSQPGPNMTRCSMEGAATATQRKYSRGMTFDGAGRENIGRVLLETHLPPGASHLNGYSSIPLVSASIRPSSTSAGTSGSSAALAPRTSVASPQRPIIVGAPPTSAQPQEVQSFLKSVRAMEEVRSEKIDDSAELEEWSQPEAPSVYILLVASESQPSAASTSSTSSTCSSSSATRSSSDLVSFNSLASQSQTSDPSSSTFASKSSSVPVSRPSVICQLKPSPDPVYTGTSSSSAPDSTPVPISRPSGGSASLPLAHRGYPTPVANKVPKDAHTPVNRWGCDRTRSEMPKTKNAFTDPSFSSSDDCYTSSAPVSRSSGASTLTSKRANPTPAGSMGPTDVGPSPQKRSAKYGRETMQKTLIAPTGPAFSSAEASYTSLAPVRCPSGASASAGLAKKDSPNRASEVGPEDAHIPLNRRVRNETSEEIEKRIIASSDPSFPSTSKTTSAPASHRSVASELQPSTARAHPTLFADLTNQRALERKLMSSAERGPEKKVLSPLAKGAQVNYADDKGRTPLMNACDKGREFVVSVLLKGGADVHAVDSFGWSALHFAATYKRSAKCVKILLDARAPVDSTDNIGLTPLHQAARHGNAAATRALLDAGASVDSRTCDGYAPLHSAAWCDNEAVVRALVEAGAALNVKANNGSTPLHVAVRRGNDKVIQALLNAGDSVDSRDSKGANAAACGCEE